MKISEYTSMDALALADLVRRREVTAAELLAVALAALEQVNPTLNAVIARLHDDAERAVAAGLPDGPFTGVPFLIKDLVLSYAGTTTGMGSRLFAGFVAPMDSELMARYRRAGLVTLGKTNTPELGLNVSTEPLAHGPTRNPWLPERIAGGSSGGSAAAVAARVVPMAHANDAGGSIRMPASCCGVFGLKPTRARTPMGPLFGELACGFAVDHAVTRSVRDSAALLDVTQGPDPGAPYFPPPPARPYLDEVQTPPGRLRIAFTDEPWNGAPVDTECKAAVRAAAALCEELGHELVPARPSIDWDQIRATYGIFFASHARLFDVICPMFGLLPGPDNVEATNLAIAERGRRMSASDLLNALAQRDLLSRQVGRFFEQFDALLTPTLAAPPPPIGTFDANDPGIGAEAWFDRCFDFAPFTAVFNAAGNPAASLPLHTSAEGLPVGVQIVGRYADEATLLRLSGQLEQAAPWAGRRPRIGAA